MECGREEGGHMAEELGVCPAYPDNGCRCAHTTGTLCGGKPQGTFADKFFDCVACPFYNSEHYDRKKCPLQSRS